MYTFSWFSKISVLLKKWITLEPSLMSKQACRRGSPVSILITRLLLFSNHRSIGWNWPSRQSWTARRTSSPWLDKSSWFQARRCWVDNVRCCIHYSPAVYWIGQLMESPRTGEQRLSPNKRIWPWHTVRAGIDISLRARWARMESPCFYYISGEICARV